MSDHRNNNYVPGSPAERISMVWPLTIEITSLSKDHNAEQRLQRHVTHLIRREVWCPRVKPGAWMYDPVGVQQIPQRGITFKPRENPWEYPNPKNTKKRTPTGFNIQAQGESLGIPEPQKHKKRTPKGFNM